MLITASVAGQAFPIEAFRIGGGSYGSAGTAKLETSITALTAVGIDLYRLSAGATAPLEIDVRVDGTRIFGGELVAHAADMDGDAAVVTARDWAGQLMDQKRVLTTIAKAAESALAPLVPGATGSSLNVLTQNQSVGAIVTAIAQQYGFAPVLNLTAGNPTYGTLYGAQDTVFTAAPESLWVVLCRMARDLGYEVHVTPARQLVFGAPGTGAPLALSFGIVGPMPCRRLLLHHAPRRNRSFRVIVLGYDPARAQTVMGRATAIGADLAGEAGLKAGIWSGPQAAQADAAVAGIGLTPTQLAADGPQAEVPRYTFHIDGLTAAQAQTKATAIATEIAKRDLTVSVQIDGLASVTPQTPVTLSGTIPPEAAGRTLYVNGYEHTFRMPRNGAGAGFLTDLRLLSLPYFGDGGVTAP